MRKYMVIGWRGSVAGAQYAHPYKGSSLFVALLKFLWNIHKFDTCTIKFSRNEP